MGHVISARPVPPPRPIPSPGDILTLNARETYQSGIITAERWARMPGYMAGYITARDQPAPEKPRRRSLWDFIRGHHHA
jgi:hypothetical protein